MAIDHSKLPHVAIVTAIVEDNDFAKAKQLINKHPRLRKKLGANLLCQVARYSTVEAIDFLVAIGWDVNEPDKSDWKPLAWAVQRGNAATCKRLLDHGADPNTGCPLSSLASVDNDSPIELLDLLLSRGAEINQSLHVQGTRKR